MKYLYLSLVFCLCGCNDDDSFSSSNGVYKGIFYRVTPNARIGASQVTLELSGGKFGGVSSEVHYPAICTGSYTEKGKTLTFRNECGFTADFDGTLILDGSYEVALDNDQDSLFLVQEVSEDTFNIYHLAKE